jgi:hypothetical protein
MNRAGARRSRLVKKEKAAMEASGRVRRCKSGVICLTHTVETACRGGKCTGLLTAHRSMQCIPGFDA